MRIGVDTGGTFTDFVRVDGRRVVTHKVRSTPDDPSRAILEGLTSLGTAQTAASGTVQVIHGSTVATNAVLEGRGARVALVTTAGFEDVIFIGRQTRPALYDIFVPPRRQLVERGLVFGVPERLDASGAVIVAIEAAALERLVASLAASRAEIVAVCLLHSYANDVHERAVADRLVRAGLRVCTSAEVLPEYREFERWSTTLVNASVTPVVDRYLGRLEAALVGVARLSVMQSNGGSISAQAARACAVRTVLSGPAAGVVGAQAVARAAGRRRLITFDMGGTSTDVSLVDKTIRTTGETTVGSFPIRVPVVDVHTIGAGGGSIVWVDSGGALRVGPESAGATPGPACYGEGGTFTVTDAHVLLGRLDPARFFDGRMSLNPDRSAEAAQPLAAALGLDVASLAEGVVRVANASMERAIRVVSLERGYDPRAFTLVAFGGAGPMHACEVAEALGMRSVMVPRYAGVLSALGMLMADVTKDYSATVLAPATALSLADLERRFRPLIDRARRDLRAEGFTATRAKIARAIDVRYVGQSSELTLPFGSTFRAAFDRAHARAYGYQDARRPVEVVAIRVTGIGRTDKPRLPRVGRKTSRPRPDIRRARFGGSDVRTPHFVWDAMGPGPATLGPAIIAGSEATVVVPPRWTYRVDDMGNLICAYRSR
jgi:N-methylhydantoinase A/oxoprolinase/acetone carboxylase beta subunit